MIKFRIPAWSTLAVALVAAAPVGLFAADKPVPDPAPNDFINQLDPQMKSVVEAIIQSKAPPLHELTPEKARQGPTFADAVKSVEKGRGESTKKQEVGDRDKIKVAGKDGKLDAILYRPVGNKAKDTSQAPLPVLVYFHGGGFVIASADVYDASARALADAAHCVVISVDYRLAPENKFPAAVEDAYAATQYVIENHAALNIDSKRVAVGGESAGGNLATEVCLLAKERGGALPVHQLLVYPVTDWTSTRPSHVAYGSSPILPEKNLPWFAGYYLPSPDDAKKPEVSPIFATSFQGLPPATIITAQNDVLADDGKAYADKLKEAGVSVTFKEYPGVAHEFFGMGAVIKTAKEAEDFAAAQLKTAFGDNAKGQKAND